MATPPDSLPAADPKNDEGREDNAIVAGRPDGRAEFLSGRTQKSGSGALSLLSLFLRRQLEMADRLLLA